MDVITRRLRFRFVLQNHYARTFPRFVSSFWVQFVLQFSSVTTFAFDEQWMQAAVGKKLHFTKLQPEIVRARACPFPTGGAPNDHRRRAGILAPASTLRPCSLSVLTQKSTEDKDSQERLPARANSNLVFSW